MLATAAQVLDTVGKPMSLFIDPHAAFIRAGERRNRKENGQGHRNDYAPPTRHLDLSFVMKTDFGSYGSVSLCCVESEPPASASSASGTSTETLRDYFPEFEEPSELCRFTDCTHVHEPDCEVKDRVERGELNAARYETYARLWGDLL